MTNEDQSNPLTKWQRRFGFFAVILAFPSLSLISAAGHPRSTYLARGMREHPELVLPLTPVLDLIVRFLDNYWYLPAIGIIAFYWLWMSKSQRRMLWCTAVIAVLVPLILIAVLSISFEQHMLIEQALRQR